MLKLFKKFWKTKNEILKNKEEITCYSTPITTNAIYWQVASTFDKKKEDCHDRNCFYNLEDFIRFSSVN